MERDGTQYRMGISLPLPGFFLAAFFTTLPNEIDEAATTDGAGHVREFWQIIVPMGGRGATRNRC